jgi:hypothetical protein
MLVFFEISVIINKSLRSESFRIAPVAAVHEYTSDVYHQQAALYLSNNYA